MVRSVGRSRRQIAKCGEVGLVSVSLRVSGVLPFCFVRFGRLGMSYIFGLGVFVVRDGRRFCLYADTLCPVFGGGPVSCDDIGKTAV